MHDFFRLNDVTTKVFGKSLMSKTHAKERSPVFNRILDRCIRHADIFRIIRRSGTRTNDDMTWIQCNDFLLCHFIIPDNDRINAYFCKYFADIERERIVIIDNEYPPGRNVGEERGHRGGRCRNHGMKGEGLE